MRPPIKASLLTCEELGRDTGMLGHVGRSPRVLGQNVPFRRIAGSSRAVICDLHRQHYTSSKSTCNGRKARSSISPEPLHATSPRSREMGSLCTRAVAAGDTRGPVRCQTPSQSAMRGQQASIMLGLPLRARRRRRRSFFSSLKFYKGQMQQPMYSRRSWLRGQLVYWRITRRRIDIVNGSIGAHHGSRFF